MLIIVEGPDCTQKTTLVNEIAVNIARFYPRDLVEIIHRGPPTMHPLDEYVTPLLFYQPTGGHHIICDRWHWGEYVYPRLLDRPTKMDVAVFNYVEMFLQSRGAIVVCMDQSVKQTERCLRERGDRMIRPDLARWMHDLYATVSTSSRLGVIRDTRAEHVMSVARRAELDLPVDARNFPTAVGNWSGETIIFGDRRGCDGRNCAHTTHHSANGTAFMPYPATSGHFLFTALSGLGDVLFANACEDNPAGIFWTMRRRDPHVVALGVNAHRALDSAEIAHASAPHPQFIRRFHHRNGRAYADLIQELIGTERNELRWRP